MIAAIHDQVDAGLDVITDGEQTRLDFNLSFYGFLEGHRTGRRAAAALGSAGARPARQASDHRRTCARRAGWARSRNSIGCSGLRPAGPTLKASVPGPVHAERPAAAEWTVSRIAVRLTEALLPIVRTELEDLVAAGCREITVDEPR